jgi:dTDP-4-amino-4,6-dideoxygalactose transaminase
MRSQFLPYCLPLIGEEEIAEVVDSLRSGWVTTGPKVKRFEDDFAAYTGARHAIAVNSCTAALHLALAASGVGPGHEVIVPTLTFCATANVVVHLGARPVLVDVNEHGLMDAALVERAVTRQTKAIVPVHFAGQACDLGPLLEVSRRHGIPLIEDAAHAVGSTYRGTRIGTFGQATAFSFYATKNMTTGEGGMITTSDDHLAALLRRLALHGMSRDAWKRYTEAGSWYYEVLEPGYKDNMTDIQAALGLHQLRRLESFIARRRQIAAFYRQAFADCPEMELPCELPDRNHVYHLFPIRLRNKHRGQFIEQLRERNIGASVHFIPLHRHPYYREAFGYKPEQFPTAEAIYHGAVSLPLYPRMTDQDASDVVDAVRHALAVTTEFRPSPFTGPQLEHKESAR